MPDETNQAFEYARKISDYFSMALNVGIGAGAAFLLGLKTHLSLLDPLEQERVALAKRNAVGRPLH